MGKHTDQTFSLLTKSHFAIVCAVAAASFVLGVCKAHNDFDHPQPAPYNAWVAGSNNCTCVRELTALKRELQEESVQRRELKSAVETYVSELYELKAMMRALRNNSRSLPVPEKYSK